MATDNSNRITNLDGIRGLLSLIVVLNHSFLVVAIPSYANVWGENYMMFVDWPAKIQQILMILGNGGTAVSMFFVMSGYVLNFSLSKYTWGILSYLKFLYKRFLRLYPAFFFTIFLISAARWLGFDYQTFPYASSWYHWWMNFNLDLKEFFLNTIFVNINLGGVTWTLRVIVLVSLFAPVFYYMSKKLNAWQNFLVAALLTYLSFNLLNLDNFRDFRYIYMFYLGLTLPKFENFFKKLPKAPIYLILPILVFTMFTIRYQTNEYVGGVYESYISWLILGLAIYQSHLSIFTSLTRPWLLFVGKISYSLYLIHFTVLYTLARVMFQFLPQIDYSQNYLITHIFLLTGSSLISVPLAWLMYNYVEKLPDRLATQK